MALLSPPSRALPARCGILNSPSLPARAPACPAACRPACAPRRAPSRAPFRGAALANVCRSAKLSTLRFARAHARNRNPRAEARRGRAAAPALPAHARHARNGAPTPDSDPAIEETVVQHEPADQPIVPKRIQKTRVRVGGPAAGASRRPPGRASGWSCECNERSNTRVCVTFPWVNLKSKRFTLDDDRRRVERRTARAGGLSVVRTVPPCGAPLGAPPRAAVRTGAGGRARAARRPPPPRRAAPAGTRGRDSEKGDARLGSCASRVGGEGGQPCLRRACRTGGHRRRPR